MDIPLLFLLRKAGELEKVEIMDQVPNYHWRKYTQ